MTSSDSSIDPRESRLVSLTVGQINHILELVEHGSQLEWGRNRRVAIRAKMLAARNAHPTPEFPEEIEINDGLGI